MLLLLSHILLIMCNDVSLIYASGTPSHLLSSWRAIPHKSLHWEFPPLNSHGSQGLSWEILAGLGVVARYKSDDDTSNNRHVLWVYYALLIVLHTSAHLTPTAPLQGSGINPTYRKENQALDKPNTLLKVKISLLSRCSITPKAVWFHSLVLNHYSTSWHPCLIYPKTNKNKNVHITIAISVSLTMWQAECSVFLQGRIMISYLCTASCISHAIWKIGTFWHMLEGMDR